MALHFRRLYIDFSQEFYKNFTT